MEVLEDVDDHFVGSSPSVESVLDTEQSGDLTGGNVDGTSRHESRYSRLRNCHVSAKSSQDLG